MAKVTAIVEGAYWGVCGLLVFLIKQFPLRRIRTSHGTHYDRRFGTVGQTGVAVDAKPWWRGPIVAARGVH